MGHAVAVMLNGGNPESKIGEGSFPFIGGVLENFNELGSIANCHGVVASN